MSSLNIYLYFFRVIKFFCIFIKYLSVFFLVTKWICIFIKYRSEDFSRKIFLFYKIVDFQISKKELRVKLNLLCDSCIISLSHEYKLSFKSPFFFLTFKNKFDFHKSNLSFFIFSKQIWFFLTKSFFYPSQMIGQKCIDSFAI